MKKDMHTLQDKTPASDDTGLGTLIGKGQLAWTRRERISDRYGSVYFDEEEGVKGHMDATSFIGQMGTLKAKVLEVRESGHVGDFIHQAFPSTPREGEIITLGHGTLFITTSTLAPEDSVGLRPSDGREHLWLDVEALYRVYDQVVELYFLPD